MDLIQWDSAFSVNVADIDAQHKELIGIINELHAAMKIGKSKDILNDILAGLIDYTKYHFDTEETLMSKHGFKGIMGHMTEHKNFIEKVNVFYTNFKNGNQFVSIDIMTFLSDWLKNHIKKTDMSYSAFFNENGVY